MRILLVEDDPAQAELVKIHLLEALASHDVDCSLTEVGRLGDALERLEDYDLVVLDLGLPDSEGLVGLEHILSVPAPPPVVVLTGVDDLRLAVQAVQSGAQDYVQ